MTWECVTCRGSGLFVENFWWRRWRGAQNFAIHPALSPEDQNDCVWMNLRVCEFAEQQFSKAFQADMRDETLLSKRRSGRVPMRLFRLLAEEAARDGLMTGLHLGSDFCQHLDHIPVMCVHRQGTSLFSCT